MLLQVLTFYVLLVLKQIVEIGSLQHLIPIVIAVFLSVLIIRYSKNVLSKRLQEKVFHSIAIIISLTVFSYHLYRISLGNYNIKTDLPLYLCSFLGLIIPVFTYYKRQWMYEVLLFWIIGGTLQAIITPDIDVGFPSFAFFRYWIVHLGLILVILYATIVMDFRPTLKSVFKSFFALQVYVIFMVLINHVLDSNYFYLNRKPESASLLDYMGDWPIYILVGQMILIPYFLLIYLPFYLTQKAKLGHSKTNGN